MSSPRLPSTAREVFGPVGYGRKGRYEVRLRVDAFRKAVALAGYPSDYALAKGMGVNRSTISRVRAGTLPPGEAFISGALVALAPLEFDDLFEVLERETVNEAIGGLFNA